MELRKHHISISMELLRTQLKNSFHHHHIK